MKKLNSLLACILMLAATTLVDAQTEEEAPPHRTSAQIVDFILTIQEHRVLEMAEVIPENKYSFAPCGEGFAGRSHRRRTAKRWGKVESALWRPSFERQRDFNPPEQRAAQRALPVGRPSTNWAGFVIFSNLISRIYNPRNCVVQTLSC